MAFFFYKQKLSHDHFTDYHKILDVKKNPNFKKRGCHMNRSHELKALHQIVASKS